MRLGSRRPDAYDEMLGAFVRRVRARRLGLVAREIPPPLAFSAAAKLPKKDPSASSITIATPDLDINRERHARGASFRGRRRGEKAVVVRTVLRKRRESGRRRNSASDRVPRLRRRPSSTRRTQRIGQNNLSCYSRIAICNLGRAVKDALRVCEWKTRVEYLVESQTTLS